MDAAAEFGRSPVSKHHIQPEYGELVGRRGAVRFAKPNPQARTGTQGEIHFPCSADHGQDWQPYLVDPYSAISDDLTSMQGKFEGKPIVRKGAQEPY